MGASNSYADDMQVRHRDLRLLLGSLASSVPKQPPGPRPYRPRPRGIGAGIVQRGVQSLGSLNFAAPGEASTMVATDTRRPFAGSAACSRSGPPLLPILPVIQPITPIQLRFSIRQPGAVGVLINGGVDSPSWSGESVLTYAGDGNAPASCVQVGCLSMRRNRTQRG